MADGSPESAGHTGSGTDDYKNHIAGPNYCIQGNILLGPEVLDSMEARFLRAEGDLACKLMAAMQGANMIGADSRCAANGSSSLFAFLKVSQPDDIFGEPSFLVSVRTEDGSNIEPIDSLQTLFDAVHSCPTVGLLEQDDFNDKFSLYPNPASDRVSIVNKSNDPYEIRLVDVVGNTVFKSNMEMKLEIDISELPNGMYVLKITNLQGSFYTKLIKE